MPATLNQRYNPITPSAAPAPVPAGGPVKKLNLSGFNKKKESSTSETYPVLPDPNGKAAETAAAILKMQEEFEALDGALKAHKKFLVELAAPFHFQNNQGKADPAKAVIVEATANTEGPVPVKSRVRVTFQNRYTAIEDDSVLTPVLGAQVGACFRQKFSLQIDGDKLPADKTEDLLGKLQLLFAEFNASDALTVKSGFAPTEDFHVRRHTLLTPEQNIELQKICPVVATVATKNVK